MKTEPGAAGGRAADSAENGRAETSGEPRESAAENAGSREPGVCEDGAGDREVTADAGGHGDDGARGDDGDGGDDGELSGEGADPGAAAGEGAAGSVSGSRSWFSGARGWRAFLRARYLPYLLYLGAAVALVWPLWRDPAGQMLADNYQDQVFFEWVLTHAANALAHFDDPLFTDRLNAPYGLNLMANTSVLALALPLAPLTLVAGAHTSFAVITTLALVGTASSWYYVLNKLLDNRVAAAVGGAFCGFAPAMISQATGHPNVAGQYVLPFIILTVLRLREPGDPVRQGVKLALLVVLQAFINEELLFLTALALGIFLIAYAAARPREIASYVPHALRVLGTTAAVAGVLLAYPLYRQFFGTGAYHGLPKFVLSYGTDLASWWTFARRSIVGDPEIAAKVAQGPTEENSFYGWPLLVALFIAIFWMRSQPVVRALTFTGVTFAAMSLGPEIVAHGESTKLGGPWSLVDQWPLFDSVVPTRLALVVVPIIGCLIALFLARLDALGERRRGARGVIVMRSAGLLAVIGLLLPLAPTPLPVQERPFVPAFFTAGTYRSYVPAGGVVLGVPPSWSISLHAMQWQTAANQDYAIFGGYFIAPDPNDPDKRGTYGPAWPSIWQLLGRVAEDGQVVAVSGDQRARALDDLRFMKATTIVMPAHHWRADAVRAVVDQLVGPGLLVDGMWVWDVRPALG